ncbi:hypothetical protein Q9L58_010028 [Maublancomyces gigas]|uniref:Uncharacterized protein n=1 Tax=Discina gigas TaxID=1032678 RepID=A0ABR3G5D7_9PEZI
MRFSIIAFTASLLIGSAMAGYNCKCQDGNGQYNPSTRICCYRDPSYDHEYHDDQVHQCSSHGGALDNGAFVNCCIAEGHGGAFCWN